MRDISHLLFQPATRGGRSTGADQSSTSDDTVYIGAVEVAESGVVHGRGLIATRDIKPGESLFVTPPTVSANIDEVKRLWAGCNGKRSIEEIAEASLLKNMKRSIKQAGDKSVAASFMSLTSAHSVEDIPDLKQYDGSTIDILLGKCQGIAELTATDAKRANDKDVLLRIVRHNAFGPDYHNYARIEETWTASPSADAGPYSRILGMYPLAAIINHSCRSNAIRVFAGEVMAVHANAPIKRGEEIGWSYIPATQPYHIRQEQISGKFGFQCKCRRCLLEMEALDAAAPEVSDGLKAALDTFNVTNMSTEMLPSSSAFDEQLQSLETLLSHSSLSNEAKRSLRLGCANFYINYFNTALRPGNSPDRNRIISLAMNLHFAFVSFHNASTEHLSVLHLCYELAAAISIGTKDAEEKARAAKKIAFWTEQLKIAHQVRYGELGNDIASVREAMKHTRLVLRNRDGMQSARWGFI